MAAAAISINFFIIINILGLYFIRVVKTHGKGRDFLSESKRSKPKLTFPLRLSSIIRNTARGVLAHARHTSEFLTRIVTTQVALDSKSTCGTAVCVVSLNTNLSNLTNRAG